MNKFTCSKFILALSEGLCMLEKTLKTTIYTKSNYFCGNFVCILLQILYFCLTVSFLPSGTAGLEVEKVRCLNLWCPNIFTLLTLNVFVCAFIWTNSTCLNKATGWSYQNPFVVAPCEVGRWGCFVFLMLVDFGGVFLQHHCFSFWLLDIFSQVVEMVFHDAAEGISKASSLSSWVSRNYTLQCG